MGLMIGLVWLCTLGSRVTSLENFNFRNPGSYGNPSYSRYRVVNTNMSVLGLPLPTRKQRQEQLAKRVERSWRRKLRTEVLTLRTPQFRPKLPPITELSEIPEEEFWSTINF